MNGSRRLALQAALGAALILLAFGWWRSQPAPSNVVLADVGAPITLAVTSVNSARRSPLRNAELVTSVVNALPARARLLVLTNDLEAFETRGGAYPGRVKLLEVDAESLTIWPQDPFLVAHDAAGAPRLLVPSRFDRAHDREMATHLAETLDWPVIETGLLFEGGNLVADDEHVFIGADTIAANAAALDESLEAVATRFEALLGRSVQVVGPSPQPVAHIDLVLTPLGGGRIAVADAGLGADLVTELLERDPDAVRAFETHAESVFFGHRSIRELPTIGGEPLRPPVISGRTREIVAYAREVAPTFDGLAAALAERGFEVIRIPALLAPPETSAGEDAGDRLEEDAAFAPGYPLLAYHNVLVTTEHGQRVVYLPRYGLEALDDAAVAAWQGAGFRTVAVDGLLTSASYGGGLRCSVKVLAR